MEPRPSAEPLRVQVLLFDGVEEQDFAGPLEVLGLASSSGVVRVSQVTTGEPGRVTARYGTRIDVPTGWSPQDADVLVVPGGGYGDKTGPGVNPLIADREFLTRLAAAEVLPVGVCTGVMVLSAAGLTRGRPCTTHSRAKADLAAQGGVVVDARVVDDGTLITAGGITSGIDAALWLVERHAGAKAAQRIETVLEHERRGTVWRA
ncbi:DJ-1/PfpI family protein [Umezawaea endophytica]|uniref:DJ-1/PfpI family protein n=1 Tax=Umezawaea endophytica TaxID=1654476 RepID=A0A9X2VMV8_9PSEU|nr:DJ-1/PfpI family protein [Umezawaea endophytica]MCS7479515.1 DJ-1/PfpI family protein [Umezawaea endophytica]